HRAARPDRLRSAGGRQANGPLRSFAAGAAPLVRPASAAGRCGQESRPPPPSAVFGGGTWVPFCHTGRGQSATTDVFTQLQSLGDITRLRAAVPAVRCKNRPQGSGTVMARGQT